MGKQKLFDDVVGTFFIREVIEYTDLIFALEDGMRISGEVKAERTVTNTGSVIKIYGETKAKSMFSLDPYKKKLAEETISKKVIEIALDTKGVVRGVKHNLGTITQANKESYLFATSLIDKQIEF